MDSIELTPRPLGARRQGARYLLIGAWNTIFGYSLFASMNILLGGTVHYLILLVVAQIAATVNAFVLYRRFVFQVRGQILLDFARFSLVYVVALAANAVLLPLLVEVAGMHVLVAQALLVGGTVVVSFFAHRGFSFKREKTEPART